MRKLIALICAIAMVMALAVPAFAAVSPDWDSIGAETSGDSDNGDDDGDDDGDEGETTNFVAPEIAAAAEAALQALLTGDLAGYKNLLSPNWLVPDVDVLKTELAKLAGVDMKVAVFSSTGVVTLVELGELYDNAFNLNGAAAVTVIGK